MSDKFNEMFGASEEKSRVEADSVGLLLRIILAVTTGGFAYMYGYEMLTWLLPEMYAKIGTTLIYMFGIDFMAFEWPRLKRNNAQTEKQIDIADMGWKVSTIMSVVVTLVFTVLVFGEFVTLEGKLKEFIDILAIAVAIGMPIFQGVWYMRYENNGIKSVEALQDAKLRAMRNTAQYAIRDEHERSRLGRTVEGAKKKMPGVTADEADAMVDDYFDSQTYTRPATAKASPNGSNGEPIGFTRKRYKLDPNRTRQQPPGNPTNGQ